MGIYQLKMPHCTYAGLGSVKNLEQIVKKEGTTSALVFTDKGIKACGLLTPVTEILEKNDIDYHVFDDLKAEFKEAKSSKEIQTTIKKFCAEFPEDMVSLFIAKAGGLNV